jgi:hypothetical protein
MIMRSFVIPAKAGIQSAFAQGIHAAWIAAFAGMTEVVHG